MKYVKITGPDICNGNGIRYTLWVSGCKHGCDGCHNSWLKNYNLGKNLCFAFEEIADKMSNTYINGITISGGDPLYQTDESLNELFEFLTNFKKEFPTKDVWLYTGYTLDELKSKKNLVINSILGLCDYLVDGKFKKELKGINLAFRGSSNQNIWHNVNGEFTIVDDKVFKN